MKQGLVYYQSERWSHLAHGIFTRKGGVSRAQWSGLNVGGTVGDDLASVRKNHDLMYDVLEVDGNRACTTWQVHGTDVVIANGPIQERRWLSRADALMTDQPNTPLVMRYADCVPLLFHDPDKQVIGLAHAGWRGTVQGMAANMVRAMQAAYASDPADIEVVIGPSISVEHYQVGEEVVAIMEEYYGTLAGLMRRDPADGTAYVDLWAANRLDLQRMGVEKIDTAGICTYANTDEFFSHRAEQGKTGRFGVVMSL